MIVSDFSGPEWLPEHIRAEREKERALRAFNLRVLAVDLGQKQDWSCFIGMDCTPTRIAIANVERVRRVSYTAIVDRIAEILASPHMAGAALAVDATGVGGAVLDMLTERGLSPHAVTITGGASERRTGKQSYNVSKTELVYLLVGALNRNLLRITTLSPEAAQLEHELLRFKMKRTKTGGTTYEAERDADHDDAIMATVCGLYVYKHLAKQHELRNRGARMHTRYGIAE